MNYTASLSSESLKGQKKKAMLTAAANSTSFPHRPYSHLSMLHTETARDRLPIASNTDIDTYAMIYGTVIEAYAV